MKKLLFVLALGVFAACGTGSSSSSTTDSSSTSTTDTSNTTVSPAPADTTHAMDSTHTDTTKH